LGPWIERRIQTSGIAIHPLTDYLYIVSSVSKTLVVLDERHQLHAAVHLDANLFEQPEGLTFSPKGHLYISNEGKNGLPNLLKFKFTPKLESR